MFPRVFGVRILRNQQVGLVAIAPLFLPLFEGQFADFLIFGTLGEVDQPAVQPDAIGVGVEVI